MAALLCPGSVSSRGLEPQCERVRQVAEKQIAPVLGGHRVGDLRGHLRHRLGLDGGELLATDANRYQRLGYIVLDPGGRPVAQPYEDLIVCLLYTSPSPRDRTRSRMPSSA